VGEFFAEEEEEDAFRLRSYLQPLNLERDWVHVSGPAKYAREMNVRRTVLLAQPELVAVGGAESAGCQLELLLLLLDWLPRRYPERFAVDWGAGTVATTTPGYEHAFRLSDFAEAPIRLCGMLSPPPPRPPAAPRPARSATSRPHTGSAVGGVHGRWARSPGVCGLGPVSAGCRRSSR
jgi:hypothetical protein